MKAIQLLFFLISLSFVPSVFAQMDSSDEWNRRRLLREQEAMKVLFIWGNVNLGTGVVGTIALEDESDYKWFSMLNAGYGAVNTTLGLLGINRTKKQLKSLPTLEEGYRDLRRTRNILLVNAGLDVGYIVTGVLLRDQILFDDPGFFPERMSVFKRRGFGASLIVQGSALLIFDSITAWSLSKSEIHISPVLTPNGAGIGFRSNLQKQAPQGVAWF